MVMMEELSKGCIVLIAYSHSERDHRVVNYLFSGSPRCWSFRIMMLWGPYCKTLLGTSYNLGPILGPSYLDPLGGAGAGRKNFRGQVTFVSFGGRLLGLGPGLMCRVPLFTFEF